MKKSLTVGVLAVGVVVGCSSAPQPGPEITRATTSAIQGGTNDTTHPFAVGIVVFPNGLPTQMMPNVPVAFCSGVLLAPNLVATARHCAANISATQIDCATATFGANLATNEILVTTDAVIDPTSLNFSRVSQIVTPTATGVCGDDLALLVLQSNIALPAYAAPVLTPPMTDHSTYASEITAIGYGITTPTDTQGTTAGTRRIRQNIPLQCISGDPTMNCLPALASEVSSNEFVATDGTCEGDSGSGAFDQKSFDQCTFQAFGVLSRGGVSTDGTTCQGSVYTRFDQYSQLLVATATQAAKAGNYALPAWAGGTGSSSNVGCPDAAGGGTGGGDPDGSSASSEGGTGGGTPGSGLSDGAACTADGDCASNNCVTADNGKTYFCASSCTTTADCSPGLTCEQGYCVGSAGSTTAQSGGSSGGKGCSVASPGGPSGVLGWRGALAALAAALVAGRPRRRRGASRASKAKSRL
jgi:hypothetical protein